MHNNGDPKKPKRISKVIGEYAHAHSTNSESLDKSMLQQKEQKDIKAIGKATEGAREAYESLPIWQWTNTNLQRWQIALILISSLEMHRAVKWQQSNRATILLLQQINK